MLANKTARALGADNFKPGEIRVLPPEAIAELADMWFSKLKKPEIANTLFDWVHKAVYSHKWDLIVFLLNLAIRLQLRAGR